MMSLASPDKLIWLLAALPVVVFYILKTRLRRRPVSTLLFWDQIFEQKRQRSLWQNLRHWISLLFQLAMVALIGFALADPLWNSQQDSGQQLILIVDNSASMQAIDPDTGLTRLETAIEQASDFAGTLRGGDEIALISAGSSVRVVTGMSDFAPTVQEAIQQIRPTDGPTQIEEAILAARRLASDETTRRIVVFSDGCVQTRDEPPGGDDVRWIQIGSSRDNSAITTFQVRRSTVDPIGYALLVEVANFSDQTVSTRLSLSLGDSLVDVIPMSIEPGETFRKQLEGTSQQGGVLTGELDSEDALATDNVARAILPERPEIPVRLMVGPDSESYYLRRVLESIPLVRLVEETDELSGPFAGLTIVSEAVPESVPDGPVLIVDVPDSGPPVGPDAQPAWVLGPQLENPIIAKQEKSSPLLRHVQLQNVILDGGRDVEVDEALGEATTLLETAGGAKVAVSVERPQGRILILASDLETSDLPLRIAFPVLMTNAMNWFFRETGEIRPSLATGVSNEIVWDVADDESNLGSLVDPSGQESLITRNRDRVQLGPLPLTGIYHLRTGLPEERSSDQQSVEATGLDAEEEPFDAGAAVAVNLCNANESDLRLPELPESALGQLPPAARSPWFFLILLACGLVIAEWVLFQRRVVA